MSLTDTAQGDTPSNVNSAIGNTAIPEALLEVIDAVQAQVFGTIRFISRAVVSSKR